VKMGRGVKGGIGIRRNRRDYSKEEAERKGEGGREEKKKKAGNGLVRGVIFTYGCKTYEQ